MELMIRNRKILLTLVLFVCIKLIYLGCAYSWALNTSELAVWQYNQKYRSEKLALSEEQVSVLLKIEDPSFWTHSGVDIATPGQGKTTITQSIVPILLYRADLQDWQATLQSIYSKVWRVAKKIDLGRDIMAIALSKKISKNETLKIFVEQAYMGSINNIYIFGLSTAANIYFNKSLQSLSHDEFASLVGMLKSPDYFNPIKNPNAFQERSEKVLKILSKSCLPEGLFDTDYNNCI